jgi:hypothetical protein
MKKEIKKVYVDCAERFITISQEDDQEVIEGQLFDLDSTRDKAKREIDFSGDDEDGLWAAFATRLSGDGAYFVEDNFSVVGVFSSLEAAEADADAEAQKWFQELLDADTALLRTWTELSGLVSVLVKLAPSAEELMQKLRISHEKMTDDFGYEFGGVHGDIEEAFINQEAAAITILTAAHRFKGMEDPSGVYDHDFSKLKYVPYALPVRKRLK